MRSGSIVIPAPVGEQALVSAFHEARGREHTSRLQACSSRNFLVLLQANEPFRFLQRDRGMIRETHTTVRVDRLVNHRFSMSYAQHPKT